MKCKEIKELVGAYLYGDLSPEEMREVRLHAKECGECREDLQTRTTAIASISDRVPELTDVEKQKIAWFVEGAVRRRADKPPIRLRLAPVFGGVIVIAAAVAIGALIASNLARPAVQQADRQETKPPVRATVKIQEEPAGAPPKDTSETARNKTEDTAKESEALWITNTIADAMQSALRQGGGIASRSRTETPRTKVVPNEVPEEVSTPSESPKDELDKTPTKLPEPSNLNDARTSPSRNGE